MTESHQSDSGGAVIRVCSLLKSFQRRNNSGSKYEADLCNPNCSDRGDNIATENCSPQVELDSDSSSGTSSPSLITQLEEKDDAQHSRAQLAGDMQPRPAWTGETTSNSSNGQRDQPMKKGSRLFNLWRREKQPEFNCCLNEDTELVQEVWYPNVAPLTRHEHEATSPGEDTQMSACGMEGSPEHWFSQPYMRTPTHLFLAPCFVSDCVEEGDADMRNHQPITTGNLYPSSNSNLNNSSFPPSVKSNSLYSMAARYGCRGYDSHLPD